MPCYATQRHRGPSSPRSAADIAPSRFVVFVVLSGGIFHLCVASKVQENTILAIRMIGIPYGNAVALSGPHRNFISGSF